MKRTAIVASILGLLAFVLGFNACQKEFSIETGASLAAQGSLYNGTGTCMTDSVVGTFYDGITPNGTLSGSADTAYVLVPVNVTTAGTYSIVSDVQNGVYFSDSGYFTSIGINTVKLYPIGTPIIPGTNSYTITFDSSTCYFTVVTKDSTGLGLNGGGTTNPNQSDTAWKFTSPEGSYSGIIDTAYTSDSLGILYLYIVGTTSGDSVFQAGVAFSGGVISQGNYNTSSTAAFNFANSAGTTIFSANPTVMGVNTIITITGYNSSTNIITGTFTGTAQDASGNAENITLGTFTAKLQ
jgi:hypothetical protein